MEPDHLLSSTLERCGDLAAFAADRSLSGLSAQSDETVLAVMRGVEDASRLLAAVQVQVAALVEERSNIGGVSEGLAARYGHSRAVYLIEQVTRISQGDAYKRIRVGKNIRTTVSFTGELIPPKYPVLAGAVEAGEISVQAADRITTGLEQARKFHIAGERERPGEFDADCVAAEEALVEQAKQQPVDLLQVQVTQWREVLDPDGRLMRDEDIRARRGLTKGRERNGITRWIWNTTGPTTAFLTEIMAEARRASIPRFLPTEERNLLDPDGIIFASAEETAAVLSDDTLDGIDESGSDADDAPESGFDCTDNGDDEVAVVKRIEDPRTPPQRDSDILEGYLRAGLRASGNEMGSFRPIVEVTAVATLNDLYEGRGVGWIHGVDEPISIEYVQELACESGVRLVILWMASKPRKFTDAVKRAVVVRDGPTCVIDGCHAPARQCDVHHVQFHSQGGSSNADNAVVLCSEHHHLLHQSPFRIEMHHGTPYLLAPRWLNPKQTWKPLSHPKHRLRTPHHSNTDFNDHSDY
jgi:hypothetical protein